VTAAPASRSARTRHVAVLARRALAVPGERITAADVHQLVAAFLAGRSPQTLRAYRQDLEDFAAWRGKSDLESAARELLGRGPGPANAIALRYRAALMERALAAATINRRLAALRSLTRIARTIGVVTWTLEVPGLPAAPYRDTSGPGLAGVRQLLRAAAARRDAKGLRDVAIVRLLFDLGLRRGEVVALERADVDLDAGALAVLGKGRREKQRLTLPPPTAAALEAWLAVRGAAPGALFLNVDRARKGGRLTSSSVYRLVRRLGADVDLMVRPHGLRHAAVTAGLDLTGDLRAVQRFSRHADVRTVGKYDDNRSDLGGKIAQLVANSAAL
jgi:integrase/recombinase XerC